MSTLIKGGRTLLKVMLLLSSLALTACSGMKSSTTPVVLQESRTAKIKQGQPAPFDGWMLTDGAMAKLLELAETAKTRSYVK